MLPNNKEDSKFFIKESFKSENYQKLVENQNSFNVLKSVIRLIDSKEDKENIRKQIESLNIGLTKQGRLQSFVIIEKLT